MNLICATAVKEIVVPTTKAIEVGCPVPVSCFYVNNESKILHMSMPKEEHSVIFAMRMGFTAKTLRIPIMIFTCSATLAHFSKEKYPDKVPEGAEPDIIKDVVVFEAINCETEIAEMWTLAYEGKVIKELEYQGEVKMDSGYREPFLRGFQMGDTQSNNPLIKALAKSFHRKFS